MKIVILGGNNHFEELISGSSYVMDAANLEEAVDLITDFKEEDKKTSQELGEHFPTLEKGYYSILINID